VNLAEPLPEKGTKSKFSSHTQAPVIPLHNAHVEALQRQQVDMANLQMRGKEMREKLQKLLGEANTSFAKFPSPITAQVLSSFLLSLFSLLFLHTEALRRQQVYVPNHNCAEGDAFARFPKFSPLQPTTPGKVPPHSRPLSYDSPHPAQVLLTKTHEFEQIHSVFVK
jgi:hypothetical protein